MNPQAFLKNVNIPGGGGLLAKLAVAGVGGALLFQNALYNVEGGERAIVYNRLTGVKQEPIGEGTHFILPWLERPTIYDVRTKPRNIASLTGSRDLQMVNITLRVLSRPDVPNLASIYETLGQDYDERVLPSIANEVAKSVVAQFNASQLITQREQVSRLIRNRLVERARDFHILLDDVSITHLSFGKEYTAAVEAKQVAQQDAERSKFIVLKAEEDKKRIVIAAEGEAQAAEMIGKAVKDNPGFMKLRRIEAARDIAGTLARGGNKVYLDADTLMIDLLNPKNNSAAAHK